MQKLTIPSSNALESKKGESSNHSIVESRLRLPGEGNYGGGDRRVWRDRSWACSWNWQWTVVIWHLVAAYSILLVLQRQNHICQSPSLDGEKKLIVCFGEKKLIICFQIIMRQYVIISHNYEKLKKHDLFWLP